MLLLVKDQPTKALCCECRHLYAPSAAELATAAKQRWAFICEPCKVIITKRCEPFNRRQHRLS